MVRRMILTVMSLALLTGVANDAAARNLFNRQADPAAQGFEALPAPAAPAQGWFAPSQKLPYQAAQKMSYQPVQRDVYQKGATVATCVNYVQHRPHRKTCCDCGSSYQTVLTVIDPRTCCSIDVPVCLPSCCTGYPQANGRNGILGRGITSYTWCCGYSVRIVVGHHGDVTVHYYGV